MNNSRRLNWIGIFFLLPIITFASPLAVLNVKENSDGITLQMNPGVMQLEVYSPRIIRVTYAAQNQLPETKSLAVIASPQKTKWNLVETTDEIVLHTDEIEARVNRATGAVSFFDKSGASILAENPAGGKSLTPNRMGNFNTLRSRDEFAIAPDEGIFGLGQHADGLMNYRGSAIHLEQWNPTESAVPVLVSSRGYGIFWDNPAITDVGIGVGTGEVIPAAQLCTETGESGGLTARYYQGENFDTLVTNRVDAQVNFNWNGTPLRGLSHDHYSVRWDGFVQARQGGIYTFSTASDDGVRLWIDGQQVIDDWGIHPERRDKATVTFAANSRHRIRMEYFQGEFQAVVRLGWQLPAEASQMMWTSEAANAIDFYFMFGPKLDDVIASYRQLTGAAPMFGKWAWGFWQCKEHYATQQELLDVAGWYRTNHVPLDCVIQDWYYWNPHPWGSHEFDTNRYPNPKKLMEDLHAENVHAIISVWPKFEPGSANVEELAKADALYPKFVSGKKTDYWYDPLSPLARKIYWQEISRELFVDGFDGWWLDASEPEANGGWRGRENYHNAFPLMHTTAVYQGQRAETSGKRVFILTRSAYAGQQRNAAVTWSGDIHGTWPVFQQQIPAGLNFSISGIPYWNTDTGGFFIGIPDTAAYAELFTRWFQFSAFCPMFRVHGTDRPKEMWRFDPATQKILIAYDELRYHLMPYIYSVSWQVTSDGYTMMRPLVMDFQTDTNVFNIADEYLFGPAILVCPVTHSNSVTREVYLPANANWFDFWTGKNYSGGQKIDAAAPIETEPLFVRAGSIIPYGPQIEYATQTNDPIELRVYRGADGKFTLYEDEGDNYNYEKGKFATIPISWNEATQTLEIGKRVGNFHGMLKTRTFRIVWISENHGAGISSTETPDAIVHYNGAAVKISAGKLNP